MKTSFFNAQITKQEVITNNVEKLQWDPTEIAMTIKVDDKNPFWIVNDLNKSFCRSNLIKDLGAFGMLLLEKTLDLTLHMRQLNN